MIVLANPGECAIRVRAIKVLLYPSLVLVQPRKTRPCLTERLLMGRIEYRIKSNKQTAGLVLIAKSSRM